MNKFGEICIKFDPDSKYQLVRQLKEGELVAIRDDRPGVDICAGDFGVVWCVYGEGLYEINFADRLGVLFGMVTCQEELAKALAELLGCETRGRGACG